MDESSNQNDAGEDIEYRRPSIFRELPTGPGKWLLVILGLGTAAMLFYAVRGFGSIRGDVAIRLQGQGVDQLQAGALVVVGTQKVGKVARIEIRNSAPIADLEIERKQAVRIPGSSRFAVESLNDWIPGNVGVRIYRPETTGSDEPIVDGALVRTPDRFLPLEIPPKFYLLIAASVAIIVIIIVIVGLLRNWIRGGILILVTAIVLIAAYSYLNGLISPP